MKRKIINDPVYGFISVNGELPLRLIEHPFFQRLRRIKQLGLTYLVYPGAIHTRLQHSLGTYHLMQQAIATLRVKGVTVTEEEEEAATIAILLHDIGHGPFSHALEGTISKDITHEEVSTQIINTLNAEFDNRLLLAIQMFNDTYEKKYFHQLISGQLDVDRLDYLKRDTFFTGVSEGVIGTERIIKMLSITNGEIAIEEKGVHSIEKFLLARRLMYWQVYLHKTVIAAESLLINIFKRAVFLRRHGHDLPATPALDFFLRQKIDKSRFLVDEKVLQAYLSMDDVDVSCAIKGWVQHQDKCLATLCEMLINRDLLRCRLMREPVDINEVEKKKALFCKKTAFSDDEAGYFVFTSTTSNSAYDFDFGPINILKKDGSIVDVSAISDELDIAFFTKPSKRFFFCYPKFLDA